MRLSWFSPWPPQRSGIAGRSAELVPLLCERGHAVDVFVDASRMRVSRAADEPPAEGRWRVLDAHDFLWRHAKGHYDLPVYQVGNSHLHRYIWPYLFRYPGLAVVHDARVHHARAEALLSTGRKADYRTEFAWCHPGVDPGATGFALLGIDSPVYYRWPMLRGVVATSRVVGVHSPGVVAALRADYPDAAIEPIALGEGRDDLDVPAARRQFRAAHGIAEDALVFGIFGGLTAEKSVHEILVAFRATRPWMPGAVLLLGGSAEPAMNLAHRIQSLGLDGAVCHVDGLDDEAFDHAIAACDVVLNVRWPSAGETSGPWVRSLALGRATIIADLPHQTHVPALDPRTWRRQAPCPDLSPDADARAIAVSIEVRDMIHSLRLAMRRLGTDATLRERLGREARAWWSREHTVARMADDYERVMAMAAVRPAPARDASWPLHLIATPDAHLNAVLADPAWRVATVHDRLAAMRS